jgi:hypothetical protein
VRRLIWAPRLIGLLAGAVPLLSGQAWIALFAAATSSTITPALLAHATLAGAVHDADLVQTVRAVSNEPPVTQLVELRQQRGRPRTWLNIVATRG